MSGRSFDTLLADIVGALTAPSAAVDGAGLITQAAVDLLPGVESASLFLPKASPQRVTVAPTDPLALEADRLQQELGEGPSLHACATNRWTNSPDVATDPRWPLYGPKVAASGCATQVAVPLSASSNHSAVLNLYSSAPGGLGELGTAGRVFASHAAVAWCGAAQLHDLSEALGRRKTVGQALGIVMERYGIEEDAAFAFLTRASQTANIKLRDVAASIVALSNDRY
jgi:ANTAR domain/GAF domain